MSNMNDVDSSSANSSPSLPPSSPSSTIHHPSSTIHHPSSTQALTPNPSSLEDSFSHLDSINDMDDEVINLLQKQKSSLNNFRTEIINKNKLLNDTYDRYNKLLNKYNNLKSSYKSVKDISDNLTTENNQLQNDNIKQATNISNLNDKLNLATSKATEHATRVAQLEDEAVTQRGEIQMLQTESLNNKNIIDMLKSQVLAQQSEIDRLCSVASAKDREIEEIQQDMTNMARANEVLEEMIEKLKQLIINLREELDDLLKDGAEKDNMIEILTRELKTTNEGYDDRLRQREQEFQRAETDVATLLSNLVSLATSLENNFNEKMRENQSTIASLPATLAALQGQCDEVTRQVEGLTMDRTSLIDDVDTHQNVVATLEKSHDDVSTSFPQQLDSLSQQIADLQAANALLSQENRNLANQLNDLPSLTEKHATTVALLEYQLQEAMIPYSTLLSSCSALDSEKEQLIAMFQAASSDLSSNLSKILDVLIDSLEKHEVLRDDYNTLVSAMEDDRLMLRQLQAAATESNAVQQDLNMKINNKENMEEVQQLKSLVDGIIVENVGFVDQIRKLEIEKSNLKNDNINLENRIREMMREVDEMMVIVHASPPRPIVVDDGTGERVVLVDGETGVTTLPYTSSNHPSSVTDSSIIHHPSSIIPSIQNSELASRHAQLQLLEDSHNDTTATINHLYNNIMNAIQRPIDQVTTLDHQFLDLRCEVDDCVDGLSSVIASQDYITDTQDAINKTVDSFSHNHEALTEASQLLLQENTNLSQECDRLFIENKALEEELDERCNDVTALTEELQLLKESLAEITDLSTTKLPKLATQLQHLSQTVSDMTTECKQSQDAVDRNANVISAMQPVVDDLVTSIDKNIGSKSLQQLEECVQREHRMMQMIQDTDSLLNTVKDENNQLSVALTQQQQQNQLNEEKIQDLVSEREIQQSQLQKVIADKAAIDHAFDDVKEENEDLQRTAGNLKIALASTQNTLDDTVKENRSLSDQVTNLTASLIPMIDYLEGLHNYQQQGVFSMMSDYIQNLEDCTSIINILGERCGEGRGVIDDCQQRKGEIEKENEEQQRLLTQMNKDVQLFSSQNSNISHELASLMQQALDLQSQATEALSQSLLNSQSLSSLSQTLSALKHVASTFLSSYISGIDSILINNSNIMNAFNNKYDTYLGDKDILNSNIHNINNNILMLRSSRDDIFLELDDSNKIKNNFINIEEDLRFEIDRNRQRTLDLEDKNDKLNSQLMLVLNEKNELKRKSISMMEEETERHNEKIKTLQNIRLGLVDDISTLRYENQSLRHRLLQYEDSESVVTDLQS